jgi:hypothetical protein
VEGINEAPEAPGAAKPQRNFKKQLTLKDTKHTKKIFRAKHGKTAKIKKKESELCVPGVLGAKKSAHPSSTIYANRANIQA